MSPDHSQSKLDALLAAHLRQDSRGEDTAAARVLARLAKPLPRQKSRLPSRWPGVLLDWEFAPAWPRVAALAGCAALGFTIGLAGLDRHMEWSGAVYSVAMTSDLSALVFEPEPLTGLRP